MNNQMSKKEKIIIGILGGVFLIVLVGMLLDLYGAKLISGFKSNTANNSDVTTPSETVAPNVDQQKGNNKKLQPSGNKVDTNISYSSYSSCIENTKDLGSSKDCCDCLSADESVRKACRDYAATYDFTKNTTFKTFDIPSTLGRNGDYSKFTASGNQQQCKQECESASSGLMCGDYQFCRTACNNLSQ